MKGVVKVAEKEYGYEEYRILSLKDMTHRLVIDEKDLLALYEVKENRFWFDVTFVDKYGHTSNKFGKTGLAIALDGLRMILEPKPTDCEKIKEAKKRIAIQVAEYDKYY